LFEARLFADAQDGKLDDWSFGEASLIGPGGSPSTGESIWAARLKIDIALDSKQERLKKPAVAVCSDRSATARA
jgi:hypothetical protein